MAQLSVKYLLRLLSDFIVLTLLLAMGLSFARMWGPITKRGFFCHDETLMYPYRKDTIGHGLMYAIGMGIPLAVVVVCNLLEVFVLNSRPSKNCLRYMVLMHHSLLPYMFGFAAERLLKEIGKYAVGRLRPFFFAVCQPIRWDGSSCDNEANAGVYIEDYECGALQPNDPLETHLRASFPSAHTSLAFYGVVFAVLHLQRFSLALRRYRANFGLLLPLLQLICILLAWFVGISRVLDYKHHWSDVLAGGLLGTIVAIVVYCYGLSQMRGAGSFLEALALPKRPPQMPLPQAQAVVMAPAGAATMSVVSTQVSDISRSDSDGGVVNNGCDMPNV